MNKCDQVCTILNHCKNKPAPFFSRVDNHHASQGGHTETAQLLIDKGADVNKCDRVCTLLNYSKDMK